jgi:cholesterol oxidase
VSGRDYDVVVVGSGFGGAVAALRLTEKGYRVAVLEAGRRWEAEDFPRTNWNLRKFLWAPRLGCRGIQRLTLLRDVLVLSGAGVGGGSLVYANVLYEPPREVWDDARWADELAPHFETARRMLGATPTPFESPAERVMRRVAERMDAADTFEPTPVGVWFGEDGVDPYFGGAGPLRYGCTRCGGCMVGCRHGAKNTLDRNYLRFAEEGGAVVHPEREATLLRRVRGGWEIDTVHPGAWLRKRRTTFRAREVVLAAGVLGTLRLLLESGVGGPHVGDLVRSNSEVIVGAGAKRPTTDYSQGIAIGSSFEPTPGTRIEPVRYPKGSNLMGLFSTVLVDGGGTVPRPLRWLGELVRHPVNALLSAIPYRWAERTVILLVMQRRDSSLRVVLKRGRLRTTGASTPTWIPEGNEAARHAADVMDGLPGSGLNEVLLNRPFTAHILGGAPVSETPETGVLDRWHRVWTEPGLHVVDGSAVSANLGVNPSLTIAAQAERAMSFWPGMGEPDPRPPLGAVDLPQRVS